MLKAITTLLRIGNNKHYCNVRLQRLLKDEKTFLSTARVRKATKFLILFECVPFFNCRIDLRRLQHFVKFQIVKYFSVSGFLQIFSKVYTSVSLLTQMEIFIIAHYFTNIFYKLSPGGVWKRCKTNLFLRHLSVRRKFVGKLSTRNYANSDIISSWFFLFELAKRREINFVRNLVMGKSFGEKRRENIVKSEEFACTFSPVTSFLKNSLMFFKTYFHHCGTCKFIYNSSRSPLNAFSK